MCRDSRGNFLSVDLHVDGGAVVLLDPLRRRCGSRIRRRRR